MQVVNCMSCKTFELILVEMTCIRSHDLYKWLVLEVMTCIGDMY
jgi:hypothetical protein